MKWQRIALFTLTIMVILSGCGARSASNEGPVVLADGVTTTPVLAQELNVYMWSDYIAPEVLTSFEDRYGVRVILDTYDSNEELLAKLRLGNTGYDLVVPADYAVDTMIQEGLAAKLDLTHIPNLININPANLGLYYDPENTYSVPYFSGMTGIAYNKKFFPTPPSSLDALFDPAQIASYQGQISMLDDEREAIGAALLYLGYSLNETAPYAISAAEELLNQQKPYLAAYNSSDFHRKLASEEVIIAQAWSGGAAIAYAGLPDMQGNPDIGFVIPEEGGTRFQDNLVVLSDSPNKYTAEIFMNYLLDAEVAAQNTDYVLYMTPNLAAEQFLAPQTTELYTAGYGFPDEEVLSRLEWIMRNGDTTIFTETWTRIKSS